MKYFNLQKIKARIMSHGSRGDTLVEVMISMTVLSLALAAGFVLSSTSLHSGLQSNQRTEALALAQAQVELLTSAKNNDASFATKYQISSPYCINLNATKSTSVGTDKLCDSYNSTPYNVGVSYNSSTSVFTIITQWSSPNAPGGVAKLNLYYKLPGTYKKAVVNTGSATSVSPTNATLNGTVNPNGQVVTACYFEYGTDTNYGSKIDCSSLPAGSGSSDISVSANLSGLTKGTTYYFRLCASNAVGTACGVPSTFITTPPPVVITHAATNITGTSAVLNGGVNPKGNNITACYFEYGPTTAYGSQVNCSSPPGSGNSVVSIDGTPTGLASSTLFHFRACASNLAGTDCGNDLTFTTSTPPPTVSLTASPTSITYNSSSTLNWSSTDASSCTASGAWSGSKATSGSVSTGALTSSQTYSLSCSGVGGTSPTSSATVTVSTPPPPPPSVQVYFCQDINYGGPCVGPFGDGDYSWVQNYGIPNDWVSSMFFNTSTVHNVYIMWDINFGGICHVMSSNTPDFRYTDRRGSWNDAMSSFVIGVMNINGPNCI